MLIFHIIACSVFFFMLMIVSFDFIYSLFFILQRYHIGRWDSNTKWKNAVENICFKWIENTPNVRPTDRRGYIFWEILKGKNKNSTIQSWQMAGIMLGICSLNSKKAQYYLSNWKSRYLNNAGEWKIKPQKVDSALLAYAMLQCYNRDEIKPSMDYVISIIESNLCSDGMISYSQGRNSKIRFVDTLGMVCPFLALYGTIYNKPYYIELAYEQIIQYRKVGMLEKTELPCHAINVENNLPLGVYGWGRGTGWYILALIETYKSISDYEKKCELKKIIQMAAEQYDRYQQEDGGFQTILQGGGQYDSTITILMAYFYKVCYGIFKNKNYLNIAAQAINKIKTVTMRNGSVDRCQGDTHGIGVFSQDFDIMPFAQGILLLAVNMKEE